MILSVIADFQLRAILLGPESLDWNIKVLYEVGLIPSAKIPFEIVLINLLFTLSYAAIL